MNNDILQVAQESENLSNLEEYCSVTKASLKVEFNDNIKLALTSSSDKDYEKPEKIRKLLNSYLLLPDLGE